ncbi:hypothetical protein ERJ75_001154100 [Trypanosoma vivax]|nr:hypothetical protein ERJ75_001154100 [Trypanosoma vivax]
MRRPTWRHVAGPRRFAVRETARFRAWDAHRRARGHRVFWSCRWRPCLVIGHGCKAASVFVTVRLWSARERVSKDRTKRGATFAARRPGRADRRTVCFRRGARPSSEGAKRTERLHGAGREGKRQFRQLGRDKREGQGRANCRGPLRAGTATGGRCSFRRARGQWRGAVDADNGCARRGDEVHGQRKRSEGRAGEWAWRGASGRDCVKRRRSNALFSALKRVAKAVSVKRGDA